VGLGMGNDLKFSRTVTLNNDTVEMITAYMDKIKSDNFSQTVDDIISKSLKALQKEGKL
jgi:hypothetical protein